MSKSRSDITNKDPRELGETIRLIREHRGVYQKTLGEYISCNDSTISNIEMGKVSPKFEVIEKIAEFFNVPIDVFSSSYKGKLLEMIEESPDNIDVNLKQVPVYGKISDPSWFSDRTNIQGWYPVDNSAGNKSFGLIVTGESMASPINSDTGYSDGTVIIIDPDVELRDGCLVVAFDTKNNQGMFRKLLIDGSRRWLKPINDCYASVEITSNKDMTIVGSCVFSFKRNKEK